MNLAIDLMIYMGLQWYMAYFNSEYGLYPALSVLLGGSQLWLFYLCLQTFAYTPIARVMEEGKWTCFRYRNQLIHALLRSLKPHHSYYEDVRYWMPISLDVKLPYGYPPFRKHRLNPIHHSQFGIYRRLRWSHRLIPGCRKLTGSLPRSEREKGKDFNSKKRTKSEPPKTDADVEHGVPSEKKKPSLLEHIDVLNILRNGFNLNYELLLVPRAGDQRVFSSAFIAAADLYKELRYDRPIDSRFEGAFIADRTQGCDVPIVIDTGCSFSVTPFPEDFVTEIEPTNVLDLTGIKEKVKVKGCAFVEWPIRDVYGQVAVIRTRAYYVPDSTIRLHSPQSYFNENKAGHCSFDWKEVRIHTPIGNVLHFPFDPQSNIPFMYLDQEVCQAGLTASQIYCLATDTALVNQIQNLLDDRNYNLSKAQKELLLWHQRLAHAGFGWVQDLMFRSKEEVGSESEPPILTTKVAGTPRCQAPKCAACQMAKQFRRTPDSSTTHAIPEMEMALRREAMEAGDMVSMDQYICKTPGRLFHTKGKERLSKRFMGGIIFVNHKSGFAREYHQVSLRVGDTLQGKHLFEKFANEYGVKLKSFRADNQPFAAKEFLEDLDLQDQTITFSGVGAHHANGVAERTLKTITTWARSMMMHQLLHWPARFRADYWPFAMTHAVYLWNHLPKRRNGLTPFELFSSCKQTDHNDLLRARVWGCPVYVLDPKLQDGKKLPKWTKRSHLGMYVGVSQVHSSTVGLVLNLQTGHVSPQYHLVFDEQFTTVPGNLTDEVFNAEEWTNLLSFNSVERNDDPTDDQDALTPFQDYYDEFVQQDDPSEDDSVSDPKTEPPLSPAISEGEIVPRELVPVVETVEERGVTPVEAAEPVEVKQMRELQQDLKRPRGRPRLAKRPERARPTRESEGVRTRTQTGPRRSGRRQPDPSTAGTFRGHVARQKKQVATRIQERYEAGGNPNAKIRAGTLESGFIQGLEWTTTIDSLRTDDAKRVMLQMLHEYDYEEGTLEQWHPMALAAKANDADTPNWNQAMNGPFAEGFWEACHKELGTLEDMGVWEVVDREPWMSVVATTFAFKIKRLPSGLIRKLKARFCIRGDQEIENVHYWETYAPVVSWTTVRMLLVLAAELGLATRQVDYTAAFVHAEVETPPGYDTMNPEEQYRSSQFAEMPRGFSEPGKVLRLLKNLYGKKSAPRLWFNHLKVRLESCGFVQMIDVDPCLFISDKVICLVYVDDTLLYARDMADIDEVIRRLREEHGMTLEVEDDVAGFLGVHIEKDPVTGEVTLTQQGLIDRIIEALHIEDLPPVYTPAVECLGKDPLGDPADCTFNYASVMGMLWYLYGHSRPDLGFACSQAARFSFAPKRSHELALIRIGQYLKGTRDKGLILKPMSTDHFEMDVYVDSDFLGLYGKEERTDPDNVKSRGGHVILVNGCPIIWQSKLIDAICLSTMMAEYYALSIAMREVLPLRELVRTVADGVGIRNEVLTHFKVTVWEDNTGALTLANLDPGQNTPRSKFYDSKVHWFRSHLTKEITVEKVDTEEQLADIFTKPLSREVFERLRKKLMGW